MAPKDVAPTAPTVEAPVEEKKVVKRGKRPRSKHRHANVQIWKKYKISGTSVARANESCPRCGPGHFMAAHKDRKTCGKCHYTVFTKK